MQPYQSKAKQKEITTQRTKKAECQRKHPPKTRNKK